MREVLAGLGLLLLMGAVTHLSAEAVMAQGERDDAVAAALRAEAVANEAEWVALQVVDRQDTICDCTYDLEHEPRSGGLKMAAAIHCKRCRILSVNGPSND
jgi:hypothetical protein